MKNPFFIMRSVSVLNIYEKLKTLTVIYFPDHEPQIKFPISPKILDCLTILERSKNDHWSNGLNRNQPNAFPLDQGTER